MPDAHHTRRDRLCRTMAQSQFGLINFRQATRAGHTRDSIARLVATGAWSRVLPRVYAFGGSPPSWERDAMAAPLYFEDGAALSHQTAGAVLGVRGCVRSRPIHISTTRPYVLLHPGYRTHRVDHRLLPEIEAVDGIPVTSARRTLLDLAGLGYARVEGALDDCIHRRLTTVGQLWLLIDDPSMWGRRGVARLAAFLRPRTPEMVLTHSDFEIQGRKALVRAGLPEPAHQFPVTLSNGTTIHIDLAYPEALLGIELDGYATHMSRKAFERDRERDLDLSLQGWLILRVTWAKWRFDQAWVIDLVRHHLVTRTPLVTV